MNRKTSLRSFAKLNKNLYIQCPFDAISSCKLRYFILLHHFSLKLHFLALLVVSVVGEFHIIKTRFYSVN